MSAMSKRSALGLMSAALAVSAAGAAFAQEQPPVADAAPEQPITVTGMPPSDLKGLEEGPKVEGFISARNGHQLQVTGADEVGTMVLLSEATEVRGKGGLLGLGRTALASNALLNGLPISVETVKWGGGLVAKKVHLKKADLKTASMIKRGTAQGFSEQTAATEALRGRVGDIDKYNVKGTTNVYFDTGQSQLTAQAQSELCSAAQQAEGQDNALLLVVGYTDSTGGDDLNQALSEKRASRVVNYLQQKCRWAPYRMLTPTGMAESDPLADNSTTEGRRQNRRVSVNILVSKAVDGI